MRDRREPRRRLFIALVPSWRHVGLVAALLIGSAPAFSAPGEVQVDDGTWLNLAPFPRAGHAAVYDPTRHRMLKNGGRMAPGVYVLELVAEHGGRASRRLVIME